MSRVHLQRKFRLGYKMMTRFSVKPGTFTIEELLEELEKEQANALELFKEMHYSKKKGFAPAVQSLIAEMEEKLNEPVDDGLEPKDVTDVVSQALVQKTTKKNQFLVNVGLSGKAACVRAERDLEDELVAEKQTSSDLMDGCGFDGCVNLYESDGCGGHIYI